MTSATAASLASIVALISCCDCATLTILSRLLEVNRDQLPTFLGMVEIEHRGRHMINLEGRRVAEQKELDDRRHDQAEASPFVAPELNELLDQYAA